MGQDVVGRRGNGWRIVLWGGAALLLLAPLAAMQFTDEVNWTGLDFATFGGLLVACCAAYELTARLTASRVYRAVAALAIAAAFLLIWANLAVGVWGG